MYDLLENCFDRLYERNSYTALSISIRLQALELALDGNLPPAISTSLALVNSHVCDLEHRLRNMEAPSATGE
jgi:hypothetical protein